MEKLTDDELMAEILREVKAWYPNAFSNPKNYPEDMDNLKIKIRKLLKSQRLIKKRELTIGEVIQKYPKVVEEVLKRERQAEIRRGDEETQYQKDLERSSRGSY